MRRSLSVRIATLVLVVSMAMPVLAAPRRDDSPIDEIRSFISRITQRIIQVCDLGEVIQPPK